MNSVNGASLQAFICNPLQYYVRTMSYIEQGADVR